MVSLLNPMFSLLPGHVRTSSALLLVNPPKLSYSFSMQVSVALKMIFRTLFGIIVCTRRVNKPEYPFGDDNPCQSLYELWIRYLVTRDLQFNMLYNGKDQTCESCLRQGML